MPIYYVDTREGSDSNNGSSWAQAWKSCYPLKALYAGVTDVQGLEIRFAKTSPMQTDCTLRNTSSLANNVFVTKREESRPSWYGRLWLGSSGSDTYREFTVPAGGSYEYQVTWATHSQFVQRVSGEPSGVSRLEWLWFTDSANSLSCSLSLYDISLDSPDPTTPFQTISLAAPRTKDTRRVDGVEGFMAGKPPTCTRVGWKYTITNPGASPVTVRVLVPVMTYPRDAENYDGYCTLFVPNSRFGLAFSVTNWSEIGYYDEFGAYKTKAASVVNTPFSNEPGAAMAAAAYPVDLTWSVYRWEPWMYSRSIALLGDALTAGTASVPLKISGGWDKVTNEVTGRTVLEAKNLQWFSPTVTAVGVDIRHIAIAGNEKTTVGVLYSSIMTTAPAMNLRILRGYAEDVHIPNPNSGTVFSQYGESTEYGAEEQNEAMYAAKINALLYQTNGSQWAPVTVKNCSCAFGYIFGGYLSADEVSGSVFIGDVQYFNLLPAITQCTFLNVRNSIDRLKNKLRFGTASTLLYDCDIVTHYSYFTEARRVLNDMQNCRLWGDRTGPAHALYLAKDLTFYTVQNTAAQRICDSITYDWDEFTQTWSFDKKGPVAYDGLTVVRTPGIPAPDALFEASRVLLKNSDINVSSPLLPVGSSVWPNPHTYQRQSELEIHNTDLRTLSPAGPVGQRVTGSNIRLHGPWTSLCGPAIADIVIDGLTMTDAVTRVFAESSRLLGTQAAHTATHVVGVVSPNPDPLYLIGTPSKYYPPGYNVGGDGFYPYQPRTPAGAMYVSTSNGDVWANSFIAVQKVGWAVVDMWKLTARGPCGAIQVANFAVGTVPVRAGITTTFKATVRRTSRNVMGGIFIRPNQTREWVPGVDTSETQPIQDRVAWQNHSLPHSEDEILEVIYTPVRDGLITLHAGCRGIEGSVVFFSDFEVLQ